MRVLALIAMAACVGATTPAPAAQPAAGSLLLGTWHVDVTKLPEPQPPRDVTLELTQVARGEIRMTIDVTNTDGSVAHSESTFKTDGSASPVQGSLDVDTVSVTLPNRRTLIMGTGMNGHPSNTRVFVLSENSRQMTENIVSHDTNGVPHARANIWTRD
jgi:hypothetical protein